MFKLKSKTSAKTMTLIDGKNKLILLMKYQEDTSIVEIKGALNSSESAFKTHVKRAKKKLLVFIIVRRTS